MSNREPLLSIQECAEVLGVKVSWFYNGSAEKDGLPVRKIGKYLRVEPAAFNDYLTKKGLRNG